MGTIRSSIELQDNFTSILYQVIDSVNLGLSAMEDLHQTMNSPVDTASIEAARESINRATIAVQELDAAIQGTGSPEIDPPPSPPPVDIPVNPVPPNPIIDQPPVDVPIQWQSGSLEVFTGSGMERFQQEVQSTNAMLEQLSTTQDAIARQAYNTNIFPPEAFQDLNSLAVRIDNVRNRIQAIENNPLNMGADAANAELELLRGQLDQAIREQQNLNRAMDDMDVQAANDAYLRLQQIIGDTERHIRDNVDEQGRFNREIEEGVAQADNLMDSIKGLVAAYATIQTVGNIIELSDTVTQTTTRLNLIVDDGGSVKELEDKIYLSAQRARGSYLATADAVYKLETQASQAFSSNDEIIAFTELLNKQFTIAGTEVQGIDAAMLQLTQAMASGRLQGDELTSILENATPVIQNIQRYLQEVEGIDASNIKELAADGVITADVIRNSMFYAADEINAKFETMPMTFGQVWQSFQNTALMAFQPVLERLNELANSTAFQNMVNGAIEALAMVAGIVLEIFDLIAAVGGFVAENWSIIEPIIMGIVTALGLYYGAMLLYNTITGISTAITAAKAFAEKVHAASLAMEAGATFAATAAQYGFNAALYACPIVWIIILIIALIALFYAAVAAVNHFAGTSVSATGLIAGYFAVCAAHFINGFIRIQNTIASFVNFFGNVFNDPVAAVKVLFYDMCLTVIGYILNMANAIESVINKIPGVEIDITSGLDNFYSEIEAAQQQVKDESGWVEYVKKWEYIDYTDAWDAGYSFGEGIDESIANFDPSSLFGTTDIPSADDYASALTAGGIGSGVDDIAGNTGAMADAMDITGEELKYLRDIAEQEAINRFTTAEISIEQTNHNTIKNGMDLDGIMSGMTDMVNEAIDISTEGVHD